MDQIIALTLTCNDDWINKFEQSDTCRPWIAATSNSKFQGPRDRGSTVLKR